ncbi:MAG: acetate/propionate family kinase [Acidobacteriaceae bacterium]|jgi:acetate kinase
MQILVMNSGSSSIKFSIFEAHAPAGGNAPTVTPRSLFEGALSNIGEAESTLTIYATGAGAEKSATKKVGIHGVEQAIAAVLDVVSGSGLPTFEAVGYRVVHPGSKLREHVRITPEVLADLEAASEFAPLHDPEAVRMIRAFMKKFPTLPHYACFDTVFHQTMPEEASTYALPPEYAARGVRRYGFHGLSCESIVRQLKRAGDVPRRMVIAHLGSGCSVTALLDGSSVDTTMGLTPTGGVVMGTRPGDLDPGLVLYLLREKKGDRIDEVEALLNHASGMVAVSGMENDVKAMRAAAESGDARATLALKVFTRSVSKAMGGFSWLLGGLDAIVFAGGIGEHDPKSRAEITGGLGPLGVNIDPALNQVAAGGIQRISSLECPTAVLVVPAREDQMIAVHVEQMARQDVQR